MYKSFTDICYMSQGELKDHVARELLKTHQDIYSGDGYVFAKGTFPVLLVAHLDTVHKELPHIIITDGVNGNLSSPRGIGGDDRCGVFMIFEVLKRFNCSVLFCEDEEIGTVGARKFIETDLAKTLSFNYAIEFDRKGKNDAVFYDCDNEDFEEFITKDFYKTSYGSFSDISVVAPFLKCAAVNLSCGYYNAHTTKEYVVVTEMLASINAACDILERTTEKDKFEYIEAAYNNYGYYGSSYYGGGYYYGGYRKSSSNVKQSNGFWYNDDDDDDFMEEVYQKYYLFEYVDEYGNTQWYETEAYSRAEAVGNFAIEHPAVPYVNVIDIMVDDIYGK